MDPKSTTPSRQKPGRGRQPGKPIVNPHHSLPEITALATGKRGLKPISDSVDPRRNRRLQDHGHRWCWPTGHAAQGIQGPPAKPKKTPAVPGLPAGLKSLLTPKLREAVYPNDHSRLT